MTATLSITYYASHESLGLVSDEEYQRFKDELQEAFQAEWPDASVAIEDDEEPYLDIEGVSGQAEQDVRQRVDDIVNDIVDSGDWRDEEEDFFEEDEEPIDKEDEEDF